MEIPDDLRDFKLDSMNILYKNAKVMFFALICNVNIFAKFIE